LFDCAPTVALAPIAVEFADSAPAAEPTAVEKSLPAAEPLPTANALVPTAAAIGPTAIASTSSDADVLPPRVTFELTEM
jgi:hypothetical protein